jgi:hypothetical protein
MFARIGVMRGVESTARYQKGNPELTAPRPDAWQAKRPQVEIWGRSGKHPTKGWGLRRSGTPVN